MHTRIELVWQGELDKESYELFLDYPGDCIEFLERQAQILIIQRNGIKNTIDLEEEI